MGFIIAGVFLVYLVLSSPYHTPIEKSENSKAISRFKNEIVNFKASNQQWIAVCVIVSSCVYLVFK